LDRDGAVAGGGFRVFDAAVSVRAADVHDSCRLVDIAMLEREPLARPQPGRGCEEDDRTEVSAKPVGEPSELVPGLERSLLDAGALGVLDALLGGVSVDHSPLDGAGERLAECLGGFEAVSVGDRHPPRRYLRRLQLADRRVPERGCGFVQQPAELVDRLGLGVVLGEVDLYEPAQRRCLSEALFLAGALERAVECLLGGFLGREAASLHAL
jgi:hypothetical protein